MEEKHLSPNPTELSGPKLNETSVEIVVEQTGDANVKPRKSWRFWGAFSSLFLCAFLSAIDATILGTALPQITEELNGTSILAFWCATSFILAKTVIQPGILTAGRQYLMHSMGKCLRNFWS